MSLTTEMELDLVHEFLLQRAPRALESYRPERGPMANWLFVVFRRFILESLRTQQRHDDVLRAVERESPSAISGELGAEQALDLEAVQNALATIDANDRQALTAFFEARRPSIRDVARAVGVSRYEASRRVERGLTAVARELGVEMDVAFVRSLRGARRSEEGHSS